MEKELFTQNFYKYNHLVRTIVFEKTGNAAVAEEICQQVFMKYYENMDHMNDEMTRPWLILTTKNAVCDYFRKQRVRKDACSEKPFKDMEVVCSDNTEYLVERVANIQLTQKIMTELYEYNHNWYEVVELICVRGISYEEAAQHLNVSEEMLRARLSRARKFIRQKYGEEYREI